MINEPQQPENDMASNAATVGRETVATARRHSEITKRLTRKQTVRRIDALKAMSTPITGKEAAIAAI